MRTYVSLAPISIEEIAGLAGWSVGPSGDSVMAPDGTEVFVIEEGDGHATIRVQDGDDAADLLERVPFEEVEDA